MKNYLLITLITLFTINSNAQDPDPDIFNQTWYLYQIRDTDFEDTFSVSGYQPYAGSPEIPQIEPFLIIDPSLSFSGTGICNTFDGSLESSATDNSFRTVTSSTTDNSCGFYEDQDEPYIIGPFGFVDNDPTFYTIINLTITDDTDGFQTMRFITQPFVDYTYRNTPVLSNESFKKKFFRLYPNPSSDIVYFSSENTTIESMVLYDINGAKISTIEIINNTIDISAVTSGVYFVEIISAEGKEMHKIIKK